MISLLPQHMMGVEVLSNWEGGSSLSGHNLREIIARMRLQPASQSCLSKFTLILFFRFFQVAPLPLHVL